MTPLFPSRFLALAVIAFTVSLGACGDSITGPRSPEDIVFNPALGIDLEQFTRLPSGVYVRTAVEGTGDAAQAGNQVTVSYAVRLPDNTLVDSSPPDLSFTLGAGQVVPGFDIGVTGMRLAEQRRIIVPSSLAYGSSGTGPIPPNSVLVFDVTVLAIG